MLELILSNLLNVGIGVALFIAAWIANFVFSIYYNVKILHEAFDLDRLKSGLYKMVAVLVGIVLLTILLTTIPIYLEKLGIPIPEEHIDMITVTAILIIIGYAILKYTVEAIETLKNIFNTDIQEGAILEEIKIEVEEEKENI